MNRLRVLVIEDDHEDYSLMEDALGGHFNLRVAVTLADGLTAAAEWEPHAVLADLNLPDSHPEQTFRRLRRVIPDHVPICICSGVSESLLKGIAKANGVLAKEQLQKPDLGPFLLLHSLQAAIARRETAGLISATMEVKERLRAASKALLGAEG